MLGIIVKRSLKKGRCEPASSWDNDLSGRCESVVVIPSEGGNTSAYLVTQRYRSLPLLPSVCHFLHGTGAACCRTAEQREGRCLPYHCQFGSYSSLCSWKNVLSVWLPSAVVHPRMHGKVITDATLERWVSISPISVSADNRLRMRFLPMFHCAESCSSEYCVCPAESLSGLLNPLPSPAVNAILANRSPNNMKFTVSLPSSSVVVPHSHCNALPEKTNDRDAILAGDMNLYVSLFIKSCL